MQSWTNASRSRAPPTTASRRSRSIATRAALTSCWSCGATTGTSRSGSSASACCRTSVTELLIDSERLVADALAAVAIPSLTGSEEAMAAWMAGQCEELGLAVQWQQVEEDRANVLATRAGTGGGPTLM